MLCNTMVFNVYKTRDGTNHSKNGHARSSIESTKTFGYTLVNCHKMVFPLNVSVYVVIIL